MKTLTVTMILAGALGTAHAGGRGLVENPDLLNSLRDHPFVFEYIDERKPVFENALPCQERPGYRFAESLFEEEVAGVGFSANVAGSVGLVIEGANLGADASLGPSVTVFGQTATPIEVRLGARHSTVTGENSLDFGIYAFDTEIDSFQYANTPAPIDVDESFGWTLPGAMEGLSAGDSIDCGAGCTLAWDISATAVADLAAILKFRIDPSGIETRVFTVSNAYAALSATGTLTKSWVDWQVEGGGHLDIMRLAFGARGLITFNGEKWVADSGASLAVTDIMNGSASLDIPDWIPWVPDDYTVFELEGPEDYSNSWSYLCTFGY
ncbi:MAG TPA: hypothetical protein VIV11_11560 [Kofleriaceae bacterium]